MSMLLNFALFGLTVNVDAMEDSASNERRSSR
jgi:hypothetical protein